MPDLESGTEVRGRDPVPTARAAQWHEVCQQREVMMPPCRGHRRRRGLALTEYLIVLALAAIGGMGLVQAFGTRSRSVLAKATLALGGARSDSLEAASSAGLAAPRDLSMADFADAANTGAGSKSGSSSTGASGTTSVTASDGKVIPVIANPSLPANTYGQLTTDPASHSRVIYVNPTGPYPVDAVAHHELQHYENELQGMTDQTLHEISATRAGYEYAMAQYQATGDRRYFDYAYYQAEKHNQLMIPGTSYTEGSSVGQLIQDIGNAVTWNGSGDSFIPLPTP